MSPGVRFRTRKLTTMMSSTVGTACTNRRATTRRAPEAATLRDRARETHYGCRYVSLKLPYGPSAPSVWLTTLVL